MPATMPPTTRNNAAHSWAPEIVMLVIWVTDTLLSLRLALGGWDGSKWAVVSKHQAG